MSYKEFYEAYQAAPTYVKQAIDSERIGDFVETSLVAENLIPNELHGRVIVLISNVLVGLHSKNELSTMLQYVVGQGVDTAAVQNRVENFLTTVSTPSTDLENEIEQLEDTVSQLEPLRTYATDMKAHEGDAPTHSSSQDALLQHQPETTGGRWESENTNQ